MRRQHLKRLRPRHGKNGEEEKYDKLSHEIIQSRFQTYRKLQKPALYYAVVSSSPIRKKVRACLPSGDIYSKDSVTGGLTSMRLQAPAQRGLDRSRQPLGKKHPAGDGKHQHMQVATGVPQSAYRLRDFNKHETHRLAALCHRTWKRQQHACDEGQQRKQQQTRAIADSVSAAGPIQEAGHDNVSRTFFPSVIESAFIGRRRRRRTLEDNVGLIPTYRRSVTTGQPFSNLSRATPHILEAVIPPVSVGVARGVASPTTPFPPLSTIAGEVDMTTSVTNAHSASAPESPRRFETGPHRSVQRVFSAAATARHLSVEKGYNRSSNSLPHPTKAAFSPGVFAENSDALYFAAAAVGCSALLCIAGLVLLLAIFRSYRLRQQKHEAAKQLIRKIYCSGELPTRELVVRYSHELRTEQHLHRKAHYHRSQQSFWRSFSNIHTAACTSTTNTVGPHTAHRPETEAGSAADARGAKVLGGRRCEADTDNLHTKRDTSGDCGIVSTTEGADQRANSSPKAGKGKTASTQSSQTLTLEETIGAERLHRADVKSFFFSSQPACGQVRGHRPRRDSLPARLRTEMQSASIAWKQVASVAVCCANKTGRSDRMGVHSCQQPAPYSSSVQACIPPAPYWNNPAKHSNVASPPPSLSREPKQEVRSQQQDKRNGRRQRQPWDVASFAMEPCPLSPRSRVAPEIPTLLFCPALPPVVFAESVSTTKKEYKKQPSKQGSPSSTDTRKKQKPYNPPTTKHMPPFHASAGFLGGVNRDAGDEVPESTAFFAACRPLHLLHRHSRARSCSTKSGNSTRSASSERCRANCINSTYQCDEGSMAGFFRCSGICKGTRPKYDSCSGPSRELIARRLGVEQTTCRSFEEHAVLKPPGATERITWVSEVSDDILYPLYIEGSHHTEETHLHRSPAAADKNGEKLPPFPCDTASQVAGGSNVDIPTHMMTTAVNKEETGNNDTRTSNGYVTENEDDAVVEFDTVHIFV